jgi:dienelactone hydrolase
VRNSDHAEIADWIKQQSWHKGGIVLLGMSHGGATAMDAAARPSTALHFVAAISMYPGCSMVKDIGQPLIPVQVHLGAKDTWTPCLDYNWTGYSDVHIYDAGHGFDISRGHGAVINGQRIVYRHKEARLSQERIREFLNLYLR